MSMLIPDEILLSTKMSEDELRCEIAVMLFQLGKLSLGQASKLARLSQWRFQSLLASREIPVHYDVADLDADLQTLRELGRL